MILKKKNKNVKNKRKPIEIYFILYLVALVMLISSGKEVVDENDNESQFSEVEFPFRIKSEKPLLVCKIITDENGQKQYQLDSINYILDYGNIKDVRYEFVVEDADFKHRVLLSDDENTNQIFSFVYDDNNRTVVFRWFPNIEHAINKTFNVYVTATATHIKSEQKLQAKTQFSLLITNDYLFDNNYEIVSNNNFPMPFSQDNSQYYLPQTLSSDFNIKPHIQTIRGIAGDTWENEIICYGFNPRIDLLKPPTIEINNSPNNNGASIISEISRDNSIVIKGRMPDAGRSRVLITVQRKADLKEQKISFELNPISIGLPNVPNTMYPNIEYSINPNIPNDLNNIAAYIKEKDNVRFRSFNNSAIKFTPNLDDIGKTLTFERYYNDKLIGQKHQIKVVDFPPPRITRMSERNRNEIILETISYGTHNNRDNTIKELKISGNAEYSQQYGKTHIDRNKLEFFEQFSITPKDNSKPFNFTVSIIDQRGRTSDMKTK